jgi:nicotinamidase-related amidase
MEVLIIIDMQNEFLDDSGSFSKNHIPNDELISRVIYTTQQFTARSKPVIFVKGEYTPCVTDELRRETHCSARPCCVPGTDAAAFHPKISELISPEHTVITKRWYSAFKDTGLNRTLDCVTNPRLYFAGVKTNVCVRSTIIDAILEGYPATIISTCCAAKTFDKHNAAIADVQTAGCCVVESVSFE